MVSINVQTFEAKDEFDHVHQLGVRQDWPDWCRRRLVDAVHEATRR